MSRSSALRPVSVDRIQAVRPSELERGTIFTLVLGMAVVALFVSQAVWASGWAPSGTTSLVVAHVLTAAVRVAAGAWLTVWAMRTLFGCAPSLPLAAGAHLAGVLVGKLSLLLALFTPEVPVFSALLLVVGLLVPAVLVAREAG